jgi:hypothetical protein
MVADWYYCETFFGYKIAIPDNTTYRRFIRALSGLCGIIKAPFKITGLLAEFHSRMEGMESDEREYLDNDADIIIGFKPDGDLSKMVELDRELLEYITDNPIFEGFDISDKPAFYSGIDWFEYYLDYDDSDEEDGDEDGDEESDDEDDDDEDLDESDGSDSSSDSDSCKVHPQD